jgi:hypothetical protein
MTDITGENALALSAHDESYDPIEDRLRAMVRRTLRARRHRQGLPQRAP